MTEKLVKYYKDRVTSHALVFKHMQIRYNLLAIVLFCFLFSILSLSLAFAFPSNTKMVLVLTSIILIAITFLFLVLMFYIVNKKAASIVDKKYGFKSKKWVWRTVEFNNKQDQLLIDFLSLHNLYNESKIKLLIETLNREVERRKLPSFLAPGIFISLFVPIWNQFMIFIFKGVTNLTDATFIVLNVTGFVAFVIVIVNVSKWFSIEILETVKANEISIRKGLIEHLENILIEVPVNEHLDE